MSDVFYHGSRVLIDGAWREGVGVLVRGGRIEAVLPAGQAGGARRVALPPEALLAPGFIDIQVNGGGGVQFNDSPSADAALHIAAAHRRLGTTAILPTLITSEPETMRAAAGAVGAAVAEGSGVLGVHFEGPFLSPSRPGVHRAELIRRPDDDDLAMLEALAAAGVPVVLTLAPECVDAAVQARLAASGVLLCAGHSAAPFETVGPQIRGVTHIFNAMTPLSARDPGLAAAALLGDAFAGVIVDGVHVHPAMLRLLLAMKGPERVMLVSDSMSVAGTDAREFLLQGRRIVRQDGRLVTEDGVLAGADLSLTQAVRNAVELLGVTPEVAIGMATIVPAAFLRLSGEVGRIAPGLRADMVLLSPALEVLGTALGGEWQSEKGLLAA
jgi:N-acetylglucosamine-6-phosphate deacetylase